jgi:hypothetical protein
LGGVLVAASSPFSRRGPLYDAFRRSYAKDDAHTLVWKAPSLTMNPSLSRELVEAAYASDATTAASEYGAEFRPDQGAYIERAVVEACVSRGVFERPPMADCDYGAFLDLSGAATEAFALAIGHRQSDSSGGSVVVIDAVRERKPPLSAQAVLAEFAALMKRYRITAATADRYAGTFPKEALAAHGIVLELATQNKSILFADLLPLLNAQRLDLLDHEGLVSQLCGLERRVLKSGKETIGHAVHCADDLGNCVAGVAASLAHVSAYSSGGMSWVSSEADANPPGPPINPKGPTLGALMMAGWLR